MADLWKSLEHRALLHQLQHRRHQEPHQRCGGVLGVSCTLKSSYITTTLFQ